MTAVGIDFGSHQSTVAVPRNRGIDVLANEVSQRFTSSIVGFNDKSRTLGEAGATFEVSNFKNTVRYLKRLVGIKFNDPIVQNEQKYLTCMLVPTPCGEVGAQVLYRGETRVFSATELCAMYLGHLKRTAEKEAGTLCDAVVGCPVWFSHAQRQALKDACVIAGLKPLQIINENTAAALTYGITRTDLEADSEPRKVLFVDIGNAGTTVTCASFVKGKLSINGVAYDANMGGRDLDQMLAWHFINQIKAQKNIDISTMVRPQLRLRNGIEKTKKILSTNPSAPLNLEALYEDIDIAMNIERTDFEQMAAPFISRIGPLIHEALEKAGWQPEQVSNVETVGGTTRIPAIRNAIQACFQRENVLTYSLNQDEAVARGCALMSAIRSPSYKVREYECVDASLYGFTMIHKAPNKEEKVNKIFECGSALPSSKMFTVMWPAHEANEFESTVNVQITRPLLQTCEPQGVYGLLYATIKVFNIPKVVNKPESGEELPLTTQIKLRVRMTEDQLFSVEQVQAVYEEFEYVEKKEDDKVEHEWKKLLKKKELEYRVEMHSNPPHELLMARCQGEQQMQQSDQQERDTENARNSLEAYVYRLREKLQEQWYAANTPAELKATLDAMMAEIEEWLYTDECDKSAKEEFERRHKAIQEKMEPVELKRLEEERIERERLERERLERERLERERLERERLEAERVEKERLEAERVEKERLEQLEKEKQQQQQQDQAENNAENI